MDRNGANSSWVSMVDRSCFCGDDDWDMPTPVQIMPDLQWCQNSWRFQGGSCFCGGDDWDMPLLYK
ncbi:hypothetical protein J6590_030472 [Homalodisca vitripennis]|nr:hypothetical protein J6590_030472 [Homalodisca vitripennis]